MSAPVNFCHRVFSGIQPTGVPHLGNYFGAISQWIRLTNEGQVDVDKRKLICDTPVFSIVDVHAYTSTSTTYGQHLYDNILSTTASLLALGLDPKKCILYRQSDLLEHNYLENVLQNFVSIGQLTRMTQYKDKSNSSSSIKSGLLNYPTLQAADILLHRAHLIPVGEDQMQHIELTRDIAKKFNRATSCQFFPSPKVIVGQSSYAGRVKSLRDPSKKMSKSDPNKNAFIEVIDEPEVILNKCKKSLTDCTSAIYYDPENRPGVSNLMRLYHLATGDTIENITENFRGLETLQLKLSLADILIDRFSDVREEFKRLRADRAYLESVLKLGELRARPNAIETVSKVKHLLGSLSD